ncbi:MAG TPA: hypothetical protein H9859_01815 [Candidatus Barnesiella excrementigallinarum]|nr:hypothetical protein [Candidatus Barnesiella excrementigallinarum]
MNRTKTYLLSLFSLALLTVQAQTIKVNSVQEIETDIPVYYPVIFDNGSKLLVTNFNYTGLSMINLETGEKSILSTAEGAGYNARLSANKKEIVYRENSLKNNRRFTAYKTVSLDGKSKRTLSSAKRTFDPKVIAEEKTYAVSEDLKIALYHNGVKTVLAPNGENYRYIWPSVSPDGKKILYTVSGVGTFICDLDGKNIVSLGILRAPKWVNDNWAVGMNNSTVNYITKSSLVMAKADGSYHQTITTPDIVAMYPSAEGNKIAFSTDTGSIYIMDISINE